jgi:hypothetical protein
MMGSVSQWVYAHGLSGTGLLSYELLTDDELHSRLARGRWKISLKSIRDLRTALEVSQNAAALVMAMMQGATSAEQAKKESGDQMEKAPLVGIQAVGTMDTMATEEISTILESE